MRSFTNRMLITRSGRVKLILGFVLFLFSPALRAQTIVNLYKGDIPGSKKSVQYTEQIEVAKDSALFVSKVSNPTLTIFLPNRGQKPTAAVVICPGGGYAGLSMTHEGTEIAEQLVQNGVAAFVLKYRLPSDEVMVDKEIGPLQDAQEAIVVLKKNAKKWNLDVAKIGIMGFSAGGHLASTVGTHFSGVIKDEAHNFIRPNFMMLIYPVISMQDSLTHGGSRYNLLGKKVTDSKKRKFSNELQVSRKTAPAFIVHAEDDPLVTVENSIVFYQALLKDKIPSEIHIYPKGGHGFGLDNLTTEDKWFDRCINWMRAGGWLTRTDLKSYKK